MDLLASLNVDTLPEQQTRTSNPLAVKALSTNPSIRLGFDVCCTCASPHTPVTCHGCKRVKYCSDKCRREDADPSHRWNGEKKKDKRENQDDDNDTDESPETSLGHTPVICALLRLCNDDEDVEEGKREKGTMTTDDHAAAKDRVRSEYESYPATLANVLMDGPPCYQGVLSSCGPSKDGNDKNKDGRSGKQNLTVHIVGASEESELWGDCISNHDDDSSPNDVLDAYADALTDLAEDKGFDVIHLIFIGPDCPRKDRKEIRNINKIGYDTRGGNKHSKNSSSWRFVFDTHRAEYNKKLLDSNNAEKSIPNADIIVFFNPGFTCPDYTWDDALSCVTNGTSFLVATNTEMEAVADCQYLYEKGVIPALPRMVSEIVNAELSPSDEDSVDDSATNMFFGENPFCGSRVRQSGTMANDLYVKNRWIFGGVFGRSSRRVENKKSGATTKDDTSRKRKGVSGVCDNIEEERTERKKKSSKRTSKSSGNTKKRNPALI